MTTINTNTRIKKYQKLRNQIEKDIVFLKHKEENKEQIEKLKSLIEKIDKKIFKEKILISENAFLNPKSISRIEEEQKLEKLKLILSKIEKQNEKIKEIKIIKNSKIDDYIPKLENEIFILNNLNLIKIKEKELSNKFKNIQIEKEKIKNKAEKINDFLIKDFHLETAIQENNFRIEEQKKIIKKLTFTKEKKTKWLFFINILFLILQITCLIIIFIIKK